MSVFAGLKRMLGHKGEGEAFIETRLERFASAGPPPPPPLPPLAGRTGATTDPLGSGLPPLAPPAPPSSPPQLAPRPKARASGANVRLLLDDGSTSELDDPELAARAEYLVKNLLSPKPPDPES